MRGREQNRQAEIKKDRKRKRDGMEHNVRKEKRAKKARETERVQSEIGRIRRDRETHCTRREKEREKKNEGRGGRKAKMSR